MAKRSSRRAPGSVETWGAYDIPGIGWRGVRFYVPGGAAAERAVVVLFDGRNVFDRWLVRRRLARPSHRRAGGHAAASGAIVVAVDHGYGARQRELLPFAGGRSRGDLDALVAFLRGRLAHDVRARLGVSVAPARWIVGGASLGGAAALYTHDATPRLQARRGPRHPRQRDVASLRKALRSAGERKARELEARIDELTAIRRRLLSELESCGCRGSTPCTFESA